LWPLSLDTFIHYYVSSYTQSRNSILEAQRGTINELKTPIIPLTDSLAVLPLVGMIDTKRAHLFRLVSGIKILECEVIVTGIRPEVSSSLVSFGIDNG
jgi:hypothetical protein